MKPFIFYSHHAQELEGSVGDKIKKLVDGDLIEYKKEEHCFLVHPIKGYNTRTYTIVKDKEFGHRCNCQAFVSREKKFREDGGFIKVKRLKAKSETVKRRKLQLVKLYGDKCMRCHSERFDLLHHIDKNIKNNTIENLMLLCIPCHGIIHANKESGLRGEIEATPSTSANQPPGCAHVAALYEYFSRLHRVNREQKIRQSMLTMFG